MISKTKAVDNQSSGPPESLTKSEFPLVIPPCYSRLVGCEDGRAARAKPKSVLGDAESGPRCARHLRTVAIGSLGGTPCLILAFRSANRLHHPQTHLRHYPSCHIPAFCSDLGRMGRSAAVDLRLAAEPDSQGKLIVTWLDMPIHRWPSCSNLLRRAWSSMRAAATPKANDYNAGRNPVHSAFADANKSRRLPSAILMPITTAERLGCWRIIRSPSLSTRATKDVPKRRLSAGTQTGPGKIELPQGKQGIASLGRSVGSRSPFAAERFLGTRFRSAKDYRARFIERQLAGPARPAWQ